MNKQEKKYIFELLRDNNLLERGTTIPRDFLFELLTQMFPDKEYHFSLMDLKDMLKGRKYITESRNGSLHIYGDGLSDKLNRRQDNRVKNTRKDLNAVRDIPVQEFSSDETKKILHVTNKLNSTLYALKSALNKYLD